jgi:hypothetical protein
VTSPNSRLDYPEQPFTKTPPFSVGGLPLLALRESTKMPELQPRSVDLLGLREALLPGTV